MTKPLVQNAGDEGQVKEAQRKQRFNQKEADIDLRWLLSHPAGIRLWRSLFRFCQSEHHGIDFDNVNRTNFNGGMRNVAQMIKARIVEAGRADALHRILTEADTE